MKPHSHAIRESSSWRHLIVWGLLLIPGLCLIARLSQLHLVEDDFLQLQGDMRALRTVPINSYRGMLLDRNGEALAISSPVPSVWVDPRSFNPQNDQWPNLAKLLNLDRHDLEKIKQHKHKSFIYLKRHISPTLAKQVVDLALEGIHIQTEYRRFYPTAEVTAHVIGRANVDHQGIEGLELSLNETLSGKSGQKTVIKDRLGAQIEGLDKVKAARPGEDIYLSLDSRLQYLAYREILKAVKAHHAKSGSIVVLDAQTSEVLAMANAPSYNPNHFGKSYDESLRNKAVTDQFEPGSVVKPISMAHVLASGQYYPHSEVNTAPGWLKIGQGTVKDVRNYGLIDLGTIIKKSSNVGISKLLLTLPPEGFYDTLANLGFGEVTDSGFPGEASGHIQYGGRHNKFALATLGFGYGISTTPLQLAQAYAVLAAGGIKNPITFIKQSKVEGVRVLKASVANTVTQMLAQTTQKDGTAYRAQVPGYLVAGKTGTARKIGPEGYKKDSHLALFAGFAPAQNPKIVIAVVIDEPSSGHYYGGQVAAPVFSNVMAGALRLMNVSPWGRNQEYLLVKK